MITDIAKLVGLIGKACGIFLAQILLPKHMRSARSVVDALNEVEALVYELEKKYRDVDDFENVIKDFFPDSEAFDEIK